MRDGKGCTFVCWKVFSLRTNKEWGINSAAVGNLGERQREVLLLDYLYMRPRIDGKISLILRGGH